MNSMENWLIAHAHIPAHPHRTCLVLRMSIVSLLSLFMAAWQAQTSSFPITRHQYFVCVCVCIFVWMHRCGYMFVHVCICIMYNAHVNTQRYTHIPQRTTPGDLGQISSRFSYQSGVCQVVSAVWPVSLRKSHVYTCLVLGSQTYNTILVV